MKNRLVSLCLDSKGDHTGTIVTDQHIGETVCSKCGSVLKENIVDTTTQEGTMNSLEQYYDRKRTGGPSTLAHHDRALSTVMDARPRDAYGNKLSSESYSSFKRLRTWDTRSKSTSGQRTLQYGFSFMNLMLDKMSIPKNITEDAAYLYRKAVDKKLLSGRSRKVIVAACIYAACRQANIPRSIQGISKIADARQKQVSKAYRILKTSLNLELEPYRAEGFIPRIASAIGADEFTKRQAYEILKKARNHAEENETEDILVGKSPKGIAAAVLYLAYTRNSGKGKQGKITLKMLAEASDKSNVTIRKVSKAIAQIV